MRAGTLANATGPGQARAGMRESRAESIDKPGSVVDSHSSGRIVTDTLKQPTRRHRGPRHRLPIWPCSRWGLPCRSVAGLAVRSYRTISPLPRIPENRSAVSFCCTFRRLAPPRRYLAPCPAEPGLSSACLRMTRLPDRLCRGHCRMSITLPPRACATLGASTPTGCRPRAGARDAAPGLPTPSARSLLAVTSGLHPPSHPADPRHRPRPARLPRIVAHRGRLRPGGRARAGRARSATPPRNRGPDLPAGSAAETACGARGAGCGRP